MQDALSSGERQALVPLSEGPYGGPGCPRPLAGFVTQLLACRLHVPAYRVRRRAEPTTAASCYAALSDGASGAVFERWL